MLGGPRRHVHLWVHHQRDPSPSRPKTASGEYQVKAKTAGEVQDLKNADTIADLQAKLRAAQAELSRASMQRDYVLRLLRQQQTLSTARIQNDALAFFREKDSIFAHALAFIPRRFKDAIPLRTRQFLKDIIVRIG
jgi:hypothetical protein